MDTTAADLNTRDLSSAKARVRDEVDARAELLIGVSHQLHADPELGFEEHHAHDLLTEQFENEGLTVRRGAFDLPTAFVAESGTDGPTIAVMCEYDALPGIGHGCGHNIIAAAALGAGLAAAAISDDLGGRVVVLGTPAEEGGGGKVLMAQRGALEGVDAAMMVHPAAADLSSITSVAIQQLVVEYHGTAAHAAASPEKGKNALDAAVIGYMAVAALRQHISDDERVHGVFLDGGDKPNIVPSHSSTEWYVRSTTLDTLEPLKARVIACLEAGAHATGCTMSYYWREPAYADMVTNGPLAALYRDNAALVGRSVVDPTDHPGAFVGSTDMGNVSHLVASIHPMIAISPADVSPHSTQFALCASGPMGDLAVIDGAKAMAMTIVDLWLRPEILEQVHDAFERSTSEPSQ